MLERHEVTNRQYKEFLDATGYEPVPTSDSDDVTRYNWDPETRSYPDGLGDYPVVNVSRADAEAYAEWAGRRLPTEVEWEAAARFSAGNAPYPWGSSFADRVFANFDAGSLVPVEQYQANELGLYDLAGNAFEWVVDAYVPDIHDTFDPESYPPTQGEEGVLKGGAYYSTFREIRISYRENNFPEVRFFGYGFRLAADAEEQ
jgi:formylglycine-generating enzyme required for sulfatase activity